MYNGWVACDTLYSGTYKAEFHALDISSELRGDLHRQGREIAHVKTAEVEAFVPNTDGDVGCRGA